MDEFKIKVMLADDHPGMLAGVQHALAEVATISLVGAAANSTELVALLDRVPCDVVVSDYSMPAGDFGDGASLFGLLQRRYPQLKLVVLTMLDNAAVMHTLVTLGIGGIVSKSDALAHLIPAIHAAHTGGKYYSPSANKVIQSIDWNRRGRNAESVLSQRESEVVRLYASGLTINEIAERLHRSKKTISTQKAKAMEKLGIEREVDLFRYAMENGLTATLAEESAPTAQDQASGTPG
ncbi:response regulator transcription factor [Achromobacter xylosoxidans]|uniref:response regulator transcription factor n=1 Tax=Alcaligenes xylosoxydans xylosoxydans TaxID=85698 RepID=UPI000B48E412|nr:response regulator transcription factor [Achromobacter xylosoxidans]